MEIKNLEKAKDLLEEIQELDQRIIKIDQFAMKVISNEITTSFKFSSEKIEKETEKDPIDKDGYDYPMFMGGFHKSILQSYYEKLTKEEEHLSIKTECSPELTLKLLDVILKAAKSRREFLLNEMEKLGFKTAIQ